MRRDPTANGITGEMLDKLAVARALRELGLRLELQGENPFKVRAYEAGARALEEAVGELPELIASGRLGELRGIGDALARKIGELHATGHTPLLDRLRAELPETILELVEVPELGPRKVAALHAALGIASRAELEAACRAGRVREVKGFGPRAEQRILENLARLAARPAGALLGQALEAADRLIVHLAGAAERVDLAGSARRMREVVGDLDLVASTTRPAELAARLAAFPGAAPARPPGPDGAAVRLAGGLPGALEVELRAVAPEAHAAALLHHTGSRAHLARLKALAAARGLELSARGLARAADGALLPTRSEEELYAQLGLPFVPPELREGEGEIEAALEGRLPADLVRVEDVRGLVHCHTRWSDGRCSLEELAAAAEALGAEYLTVTDHSRSAAYAGGLTAERLEAQAEEIARVQERVKVRLLRGTEADITEEGALDFPDAVLERLDVVIASVHARFRLDEDAMTRRLVRAMRAPVFKIWGHPRGRLLLEREPFACRLPEVLDALAASRGAVEVNGDPKRLELDPAGLRLARERGIPVVLSVDAHSVAALSYLRLAVGTARRGWVQKGEVLNTLGAEAFARAVRPAG